jgi:hypothetical protein
VLSVPSLQKRGMEMWKTKPVSHISTPPTATADNCRTKRYTNISLGTKIGHSTRKGQTIAGLPQGCYKNGLVRS